MTMGNSSSGISLPKCPAPFESVGNLTCVMPCPTEKGYERRNTNGGFQCVYRPDTRYSTTLNTVSATVFNGSTLQDLQKEDGRAYSEFVKERDRFVNEIIIIDEKIGKETKLKDAFQRLQDAENARDKAPDAYQQARATYYILREGEGWKEREKERLLKSDIEPKARQFEDTKQKALQQYETQRKTVDVVNGLKDRVLSIKDELKYAANTFKEQLDKVQDAINRERRGRTQETKVSFFDWLDTILNIVIIGALLYVIYIIYRKYMAMPKPPAVITPVRTL